MWWNKWFKPTPKLGEGSEQEIKVPEVQKHTPAQICTAQLLTLLETVDLDRLCNDTVLRRCILVMYWPDIHSLFDVLISGRKSLPTTSGVNLYNYFKEAGCPPSVCVERLIQNLDKSTTIPHSVYLDIKNFVIQIDAISRFAEP